MLRLHLAAGAVALPAVSRVAKAQTYPTRPITIIVPFPAGGAGDAAARIIAEWMRRSLAQAIIIENVAGADTSILPIIHQWRGMISRRTILEGSAPLAAGSALADGAPARAAANLSDPMMPVPLPAQVPAKEGLAQLPGTGLGYWDTGGDGAPIVLLHPATGSALIWAYQQPVFAKAGYRVISYSRRGHHNSEPVPRENPGTASQDLHNLKEFLNIGKFHRRRAARLRWVGFR